MNLSYRATDEPSTRHRALNIVSPTIELSGEYRCQVSSLDGEDSRSKKMIIYGKSNSVTILAPMSNVLMAPCVFQCRRTTWS